MPEPDDSPHAYPITAELDLHTFRPQDAGIVVNEYLEQCRQRGLREVRIVHGQGRGELLRSVHALLARSPHVESYALANRDYGGPGATFARLKPPLPD